MAHRPTPRASRSHTIIRTYKHDHTSPGGCGGCFAEVIPRRNILYVVCEQTVQTKHKHNTHIIYIISSSTIRPNPACISFPQPYLLFHSLCISLTVWQTSGSHHPLWDNPYAPPSFDNTTIRDQTITVGQTANLPCTVRNLGDRAVSRQQRERTHTHMHICTRARRSSFAAIRNCTILRFDRAPRLNAGRGYFGNAMGNGAMRCTVFKRDFICSGERFLCVCVCPGRVRFRLANR